MNERIKELALRATVSEPYYPAGNDGHPEYRIYVSQEKFAELIVRECANLFEIEYGTSEVSGNEVARVLQRHFGVEE